MYKHTVVQEHVVGIQDNTSIEPTQKHNHYHVPAVLIVMIIEVWSIQGIILKQVVSLFHCILTLSHPQVCCEAFDKTTSWGKLCAKELYELH